MKDSVHIPRDRWRTDACAWGFGLALIFTGTAWAGPKTVGPRAHQTVAAKNSKATGSHKDKASKAKATKATHGAPPPARVIEAAPKVSTPAPPPAELKLAIERATLDNGLRVVINVDHTAPTVAIAVAYNVGSRDEEPGRSGFAHLFEHLMFQGSRNVEKGGHFHLVSGHGGVLNGTTNTDRTDYYEVLPSNELALGLWLEADRMKALDVSLENFENQRRVVQEEYRMRVSNVAYARSEIRLEELIYKGYFPYEHSTIGSMADLDAAQTDWVKDFYSRHYGPNNAVLTVAGDVAPEEALAMVHRYFDGVPRVEVSKRPEISLPDQTSERSAVLRDSLVRTPGVLLGWAVPPTHTPDFYALELAGIVLGQGESSRLHQLLVRDRSLLQSVSAGVDARRGPSPFIIDAKLAEGARVAEVRALLIGEVEALATRGPTAPEVEKAHRRAEAALVLGLQSNLARARELGEFELFYGDAKLLEGELAHYLAVTAADIRRAAATYLAPARRTIVETLPADYSPTSEAAPRPAPTEGIAAKAGPHARVKHPSKKKSGETPAKPKKKKG